MRKIIIGLTAAVLVSAGAWVGCSQAADEAAPAAPPAPATPAPAAPAAGGDAAAPAAAPAGGDAGACCKADDTTPTLDLIKATPKGGLHNPYKDKIAEFADAGHKKYMSAGCNGCHGGGGGGGMCPPLTNDTWVYGPDDDTLFRLIALGSDGLKAHGLPSREAGSRGRSDAPLRRDHQDLRRSLENHHLDPVGQSKLSHEAAAPIVRSGRSIGIEVCQPAKLRVSLAGLSCALSAAKVAIV